MLKYLRIVTLLGILSSPVMCADGAAAGTLDLYACGSWSVNPGPFQPAAHRGFRAVARCGPGGAGLQLIKPGGVAVGRNEGASWQATAPQGIEIHGLWVVGANSAHVGDGHGYSGAFFWSGASNGATGITKQYPNVGCCRATFNSRHIGWFFSCQRARCSDYAYLQVGEILVSATETRGPSIVTPGSNNLWLQHGWVRGSWPITFSASDPSGVCTTGAALGDEIIQGPQSNPSRSNWQQCPNQTFSRAVETTGPKGSAGQGQGDMTLAIGAKNAAGVNSTSATTVHVDNSAPTISLSGPITASTTAGTQFIAAAASAGPSGVSGIGCSVDGASRQWYGAAAAAVPVSGFGVHHVTCTSYNKAVDSAGQQGSSQPATWTIAIREPSVSTLSFARLVGRPRCVRTRVRIRVPARWVTVVLHGQPVRVKVPAQTRVAVRVKCHSRVALKRVYVRGHWVTRRVHVTPRIVRAPYERIGFGKGADVSGWLGGPNGNPLVGQPVSVLTAPDNGSNAFTQVATVTTASDGTWTAHLAPGPSRVVKAFFPGNIASEPSESPAARLAVPASLNMSIAPHHSHWGATIVIAGRLKGGYVPPAGEVVVLWVGWRGGSTEIGHLYSKSDGSFRSTYTFLRGHGTEHYRFWAATAAESDYPYAPHKSSKVAVTVTP